MYDTGGLEILTEQECRDLLGGVTVGRVVFTDRALPAIQPVGFALCDDEVIIRTTAGSKLAAAAAGTVVAFEADEFDSSIVSGWSVVVVGHARVMTEDGRLPHLPRLPLQPWNPDEPDHYIAITPELISGRRVRQDT